MSLETLPSVPILCIFSHLPVENLLTIDQVYLPWIVEQRTECHRRRELTIRIGCVTCDEICDEIIDYSSFVPPFVQELASSGTDESASAIVAAQPTTNTTKWSFVGYNKLAEDDAQDLVDTFPNITRLSIVQIANLDSASEIDAVTLLLKSRWSSTLTSLKMLYPVDCEVKQMDTAILVGQLATQTDAINALSNLKQLTFSCDYEFEVGAGKVSLDLSILSQLTELTYHAYSRGPELYDSLRKYAQYNRGLKNIKFHFPWIYKKKELRAFSRELFPRFTSFNFGLVHAPFMTQFSSLTSLSICVVNHSFGKLVKRLASLHHLAYLYLQIEMRRVRIDQQDLPQLPSVKVLTLSTDCYSHECFEPLRELISKPLFPNLFALRLLNIQRSPNFSCLACDVKQRFDNDDDALKCFRALIAPFEDCGESVRKFRGIRLYNPELMFDCAWPIDFDQVNMVRLDVVPVEQSVPEDAVITD